MIKKLIIECKSMYMYYLFKKMGIARRLLFFFLVIIFLPLLAVNLYSYVSMSKYLATTNVKYMMDINRGLYEEIKAIKNKDEEISDLIMAQSQNVIQKGSNNAILDSSIDNAFKTHDINKLLFGYAANESISRISIIVDDDTIYSSFNTPSGITKDSDIINSIIYKKAKSESKGENIWIPAQDDIYKYLDNNPFLYIVRKIYSLNNVNKEIGIEIIQLNYDKIANIMKSVYFSPNEYFILTDNKGTIICNTLDTSEVGNKLEVSISSQIQSDNEGYFYAEKEKKRYIFSYINTSDIGWTIIRGTPYESIVKKSNETRFLSFTVLLVCLLAAILFTIVFSRNIVNPIRKLAKNLSEFGSGKLFIKANVDREDEIGLLQKNFNIMSDEIRNLVQKNDYENRQRRLLELTVLEYQINPHFLYNTLDSINWMAKKLKQKDISVIVTSLAKFYRLGLNKGREVVKIREEFEHSECFLQIYKYRYNNCFNYKINLDETIADYDVIKVILQPIVENAIKYGVNKNSLDGLITINGRIEECVFLFEVIDNGKGIEDIKLKEIRESLAHDTNDDPCGGFGLINVNRRIKLKYGAEYGLSINSNVGSGTIVQIRIPIIT